MNYAMSGDQKQACTTEESDLQNLVAYFIYIPCTLFGLLEFLYLFYYYFFVG